MHTTGPHKVALDRTGQYAPLGTVHKRTLFVYQGHKGGDSVSRYPYMWPCNLSSVHFDERENSDDDEPAKVRLETAEVHRPQCR